MMLKDRWDFPAKATFYELEVRDATAVARAVLAFAERGEGELKREGPHWVLPAGRHVVVLAIDRNERTVTVLRIFRARFR
jgi:hypothetical protein